MELKSPPKVIIHIWWRIEFDLKFPSHSFLWQTHYFFHLLYGLFIAILSVLVWLSTILTQRPNVSVVDLYTCEINFNTVRLIAVFIICLGFLMLLLPEDWDQCIIQLSTKLRKRDEPAEGSVEAGATTGLNWRGRARTSMSTFAHWLRWNCTMQTATRHTGRQRDGDTKTPLNGGCLLACPPSK